MTDGVMEIFTGALLEPYCDGCGGRTDNHGQSYVDQELPSAAVTQLGTLGFPVRMHAIWDRAVRNALDAVESARRTNGTNDNRHHIAHLQLVHPDDIHGEPSREHRGRGGSDRFREPCQRPVPAGAGTVVARGGLGLHDRLDVNNDDDDGGAIAIGKRADLARLDRDVLAPGQAFPLMPEGLTLSPLAALSANAPDKGNPEHPRLALRRRQWSVVSGRSFTVDGD